MHVDPGDRLEQRGAQVPRVAVAPRPEDELARRGLGRRDDVLRGLVWGRGRDDEDAGRQGDGRDLEDVQWAGVIARSTAPADYWLLDERLRDEPYGFIYRKDDPHFKALVDETLASVMRSGEFEALYTKWFQRPVPPANVNLNFPMSPPCATPTATRTTGASDRQPRPTRGSAGQVAEAGAGVSLMPAVGNGAQPAARAGAAEAPVPRPRVRRAPPTNAAPSPNSTHRPGSGTGVANSRVSPRLRVSNTM